MNSLLLLMGSSILERSRVFTAHTARSRVRDCRKPRLTTVNNQYRALKSTLNRQFKYSVKIPSARDCFSKNCNKVTISKLTETAGERPK